jgi:hypothetical protein
MTTLATDTLATMTATQLADAWNDAKADESRADKIRKAAAKVRGEIAAECDKRFSSGDIVQAHGPLVGAVRPLVPLEWNVVAYDVTAKAAVLDALRPFLTPELAAMVAQLEKANRTPVRKLAFKPAK